MDGRARRRREDKKTNITKGYYERKVFKSHHCSCPEDIIVQILNKLLSFNCKRHALNNNSPQNVWQGEVTTEDVISEKSLILKTFATTLISASMGEQIYFNPSIETVIFLLSLWHVCHGRSSTILRVSFRKRKSWLTDRWKKYDGLSREAVKIGWFMHN